MERRDPASSHLPWFTKKKYVILLVVGMILLLGWLALSMTLLNDQWLKSRLVEYVRESFNAELEVQELSFSPWKGEAELNGVVLEREQPLSRFHVVLDSAELEMRIFPLLWREVDVTRLVLTGPHVTCEKQQPKELEPEPTLERAERYVMLKIIEGLVRLIEALVRLIMDLIEIFFGGLGATPEWQINLAELTVRGGQVDYKLLRDGEEPFEASAKNVEYSIRNLDLSPRRVAFRSPMQFFRTADLHCELDLGGIPATVDQSLSAEPYSVALTGIDLAVADRHLRQKDALVVREGVLDFTYLHTGEECQVEAKLGRLKLERNPEAEIEEVLFVPVDRLISYVEESGGDLTLRFQVDREEISTSEDLQFLMIEIWREMWIQVLAKYKDEGLKRLKERYESGDFKQLKEEGTEMIRKLLRPKREEGDPP